MTTITQKTIEYLNLDVEAQRLGSSAIEERLAGGGCSVVSKEEDKDKTHFKKMVKKLNKCFNKGKDVKPVFMMVRGGGPAINCHENSRRAVMIMGEEWVSVKGFNICSCDCSKLITSEIHSVIKNVETGEYIDYTTDFDGEKFKWFLECDWITKNHIYLKHLHTRGNARVFDTIINIQEHKCVKKGLGFTYETHPQNLNLSEVEQVLDDDFIKEDMSEYNAKVSITETQKEYYEKLKEKSVYDYRDNTGEEVKVREDIDRMVSRQEMTYSDKWDSGRGGGMDIEQLRKQFPNAKIFSFNSGKMVNHSVKDMGKCECGNEISTIGWEIGDAKRKYCEECYNEDQEEEPPITEDSFKFNTKCVCSKEGENDYPCMCDIHEDEVEENAWKEKLTEEEKVRWSHYDDTCGEVGCKNIVGRHSLYVGTIGFPICFSCDANGAYEDELADEEEEKKSIFIDYNNVDEDDWSDDDPR